MKKLLLLSSLALLLVSCSGGTNDNTPSAPVAVKDYQVSIDTASSKIKSTQEFADCMAPAVNSCINTVGMQLAQKAKDVTLCNELPRADQQDGCRFAIVMSNASETGDVSLCAGLSDMYQSRCVNSIYKSLAMKTKDITLCDKIESTGNKTGTGASPMLDESGRERDQCVLGIVMSSDTASSADCDKMSTASMKNTCLSSLKSKISREKARP